MENIKLILDAEYENALKKKTYYENVLAQLPKGVIIKKTIKGRIYYYLLYRDRGKVRFDYKGVLLSAEEIKRYDEAKILRDEYKKLLTSVKARIRYLSKLLRHKEV
jgi:hypothetical protein